MSRHTGDQSSDLTQWTIRFQNSKLWRFLPVILIAVGVLAVASYKLIPTEKGEATVQTHYSKEDADLLCGRFCDALLYCQADALQGRDEATKRAVRSACYTGCRKHSGKLASCETILRNEKSGPEQCRLLSGCIR